MPEPAALVLSPEAPYPLAGGGALRTASVVEYLAPRYATDLILFREPGAPDPRLAIPRGLVQKLHVIDLPYHSKRAPARAWRNFARLLRGVAPLPDRFAGFGPSISAFLEGKRYDLALIEHSCCAPYVETIAPHAASTFLNLHNIESALLESYAQSEPGPLAFAFRRFATVSRDGERRWFPLFTKLLVASDEDRFRALALCPGAAAHVYPNAIPLPPLPRVAERNAVVFSGNLEYQPNISAVRWFANEVWPELRARYPDLIWRIVGRNSHGIAKLIAGVPRVELSGPVANSVEALAEARVVVVPLLAGSGTRLKILEAWAAARPVVSTTLGAEGLGARDGEHLILADSTRAFAAAVSRLLESPDDRAGLGAAGRLLLEQRFTWEQCWKILDRLR